MAIIGHDTCMNRRKSDHEESEASDQGPDVHPGRARRRPHATGQEVVGETGVTSDHESLEPHAHVDQEAEAENMNRDARPAST